MHTKKLKRISNILNYHNINYNWYKLFFGIDALLYYI
jgi:hypothetical protein